MLIEQQMTANALKAIGQKLRKDGGKCPCCDQYVKEYRRTITSSMGAALIYIHNYFKSKNANEWLHVPSHLSRVYGGVGVRGGDWAKLKYWGLIEDLQDVRADGSKRVGYWKITKLGNEFVRDRATVPKYAMIYNGDCEQLFGPLISIRGVLTTRFNYDDLMNGTGPVPK
jgi:hypothetical protein